jgi:hypothetical protein
MNESTLFEERLWYPTRPIVLLLGFCYLVLVVVGLLVHADLNAWIRGFAVCTLGIPAIGAVFKLSYRRLITRVHEHTLEVGREFMIPRESVREPQIVSGQELKRLTNELRRGPTVVSGSRNPQLRGLVLTAGTKTALFFRVDPPVQGTAMFIVSTRRPDELLAAVIGNGDTAQDAHGDGPDAAAED